MKQLITFLLLTFSLSLSAAKPHLVVGMLAFEPIPIAQARWQALEQKINQNLQNLTVTFQPLSYEQLEQAVQRREIDFVFTNPGHYVQLTHTQGLTSPLVTLIKHEDNTALRGFGGVIFVRNDRTDLLDFKDLKGLRISMPRKESLGGYMIQAYEMLQHGIDVAKHAQLIETDMPHDKAVMAVLNRQTEAAFIRTGVLESMSERGLIDLGDIRVLNPQKLASFPLALSTRLYPEWPLAALNHVNEQQAGQLAGALLALPYQGPELQLAGVHGFSIPANYEPVRELMRHMKIPPYDFDVKVTWQDIWQSHQLTIQLMALATTVIFLLGFVLIFLNFKLKLNLRKLNKNEKELRLAAVAFETQEAILITDKSERIISINKAFTDITGFKPEDILGKTPRVLKSNLHDKAFYRAMWDELLFSGKWQGEVWNKRKTGELYPEFQSITAIKDQQGETSHYLSTFTDISQRKLNEQQINKLAFYDPLTELANRRLLEDHIKQSVASSSRNRNYCALLFIDLDRFKNINDTLGHKMGDLLLQQVAKRLNNVVRDGDTVARPGGDEFIILLDSLSQIKTQAAKEVQWVGQKLLEAFKQPFTLSNKQYSVTASIGVNLFTGHYESIDELMKRSDLAMYKAKEEGRNTLRFFDTHMQIVVSKRIELENQLRKAINANEFQLFYQPKVDLSYQLIGYEALIRWIHPLDGMISPAEFIPLAEETGLIESIGDWVLNQACLQLHTWASDPQKKHLSIAVNISAVQLQKIDFVDNIIATVERFQFDPKQLELEITESMLMNDIHITNKKMAQLSTHGIKFSLDDFGTGYSSLSYLKNLPLSFLKIDQSFVRDMLVDSSDAAIIETVIALAKTLKLNVIAEGVESQQQAEQLTQMGCDLFQGYFFGKPQPLTD